MPVQRGWGCLARGSRGSRGSGLFNLLWMNTTTIPPNSTAQNNILSAAINLPLLPCNLSFKISISLKQLLILLVSLPIFLSEITVHCMKVTVFSEIYLKHSICFFFFFFFLRNFKYAEKQEKVFSFLQILKKNNEYINIK